MEAATVPNVGHAPTLEEPEAVGGDRPAAGAGPSTRVFAKLGPCSG